MKWENREKGREGEERRKAGRSSLAVQTVESLPRETKGLEIEPCLINGKQSPVSLMPCLINVSEDFMEQVQENLTLTFSSLSVHILKISCY